MKNAGNFKLQNVENFKLKNLKFKKWKIYRNFFEELISLVYKFSFIHVTKRTLSLKSEFSKLPVT